MRGLLLTYDKKVNILKQQTPLILFSHISKTIHKLHVLLELQPNIKIKIKSIGRYTKGKKYSYALVRDNYELYFN